MVDKKFGRKTEQEGEPGKIDGRKAQIRGVAGMIKPDLKRVILQELKLDDWQIEAETLAAEIPGWILSVMRALFLLSRKPSVSDSQT